MLLVACLVSPAAGSALAAAGYFLHELWLLFIFQLHSSQCYEQSLEVLNYSIECLQSVLESLESFVSFQQLTRISDERHFYKTVSSVVVIVIKNK